MQSAITSSDVTSFASLAPAYPELVLAIGAVVLLLIALFWKNARPSVIAGISIVLLLAVLAVLVLQPGQGAGSSVLFNGVFIVDGFARYMKALVLGGAAFILLISISSARAHGLDKFEFSILTLLATLGM
ncbi:MAG: NADH-quinone oxidoreductase subunit N, partial [Rhizobiaceae bacterium]